MRGGVVHLDPLYAVETYGKVVRTLSVRLQQSNLRIDVRGHFRSYRETPGSIFRRSSHPLAGNHAASVLEAHQRLAAFSSGDIQGGLLPYLIRSLVGGEGKHSEGFGIPAVGTAAEFGPVNREGSSADMAGHLVAGQHEIPAPLGIVHAEAELGIAGANAYFAALYLLDG